MERVASSSRPLFWRLFLLAASGLVPLAIVLLLSTAFLAQERHAETQRSANEDAADRFDAHLTKPVAPDALLHLIRRLMAGEPQH